MRLCVRICVAAVLTVASSSVISDHDADEARFALYESEEVRADDTTPNATSIPLPIPKTPPPDTPAPQPTSEPTIPPAASTDRTIIKRSTLKPTAPCSDYNLLTFGKDNTTGALLSDITETTTNLTGAGLCKSSDGNCAILLSYFDTTGDNPTDEIAVVSDVSGGGCSWVGCFEGECGGRGSGVQSFDTTNATQAAEGVAVFSGPNLSTFLPAAVDADQRTTFLPRNGVVTLMFASTTRRRARTALASSTSVDDVVIDADTSFAAADQVGTKLSANRDTPIVQIGSSDASSVVASAGITADGFPYCTYSSVVGVRLAPLRVQTKEPAHNIFVQYWNEGGSGVDVVSRAHIACSISFVDTAAVLSLSFNGEVVSSGQAYQASVDDTPNAYSTLLMGAGWLHPVASYIRLSQATTYLDEFAVSTGAQTASFRLSPEEPETGLNLTASASAAGAEAVTLQGSCPYNPSKDQFSGAEGGAMPYPFLHEFDEEATLAKVVNGGSTTCGEGFFSAVSQQTCTLTAMLLNISMFSATPITNTLPAEFFAALSSVDEATQKQISIGNQLKIYEAFSANGLYHIPTGCRYRPDPPFQGLWFFANTEVTSELALRPTSASEWLLCAKAVVVRPDSDDDDSFKNSAGLGVLIAALVGICVVSSYCRYERSRRANRFFADRFDHLHDEGDTTQRFACSVVSCTDGPGGGPYLANSVERLKNHIHLRHTRKQLCSHGILPGCCEACESVETGGAGQHGTVPQVPPFEAQQPTMIAYEQPPQEIPAVEAS